MFPIESMTTKRNPSSPEPKPGFHCTNVSFTKAELYPHMKVTSHYRQPLYFLLFLDCTLISEEPAPAVLTEATINTK